jgi:hypothetical protein
MFSRRVVLADGLERIAIESPGGRFRAETWL